jgi:hypothetical protein
MERRTFLATASLSPLFAHLAAAQGSSASFTTVEIEVAGNQIFVGRYGQGPWILMRRPARLRPKRDTDFRGRPFSVFQASHGEGTG